MEVEIRDATWKDVDHVLANLREADMRELNLASGFKPFRAIAQTMSAAPVKAGLVDGKPVCLFGVVPFSISGGGCPWMVGTDGIESIPRTFVRESRKIVQGWRREFPYLENWVHDENEVSKRWLRWLGFALGEPEPFGPYNAPFRRFVLMGVQDV